MKKALILLVFLHTLLGYSQTEYKFRVWLKDKNGTNYSLNKPNEFLNSRSLERRHNQNRPIDSTDIPVSTQYKSTLSNLGVKIIATSRWMNTVVISTTDSTIISTIRKLIFVKALEWVWQGTIINKSAKLKSDMQIARGLSSSILDEYGYGLTQLSVSNGQKLHQAGFRGEGKMIALIDAGFQNADTISAYKPGTILGTRDFVNPGGNVFSEDKHGQSVLSIMAAIDSFQFIGAAPHATYWLLRSEDAYSEYPVEEDYWASAAEFADSVGVDLINTSLGYNQFDAPQLDHTLAQLDGKTIFVSRVAQIATNKGIFVVVSAGNEGNKAWQKIGAPADAADVLTVGSVNIKLQISAFSSIGFTADNRVKPDVVSIGEGTYLLDSTGKPSTSNGTSFSAPLMTGMIACLWQALPQLSNKQLLDLIRSQSSFFTLPDIHYGYGIPDMWSAYQLVTGVPAILNTQPEVFFNNKKGNSISIRNLPNTDSIYKVNVYSETGRILFSEKIDNSDRILNVKTLKHGFYIVYIEGKTHHYTKKLVK